MTEESFDLVVKTIKKFRDIRKKFLKFVHILLKITLRECEAQPHTPCNVLPLILWFKVDVRAFLLF